jgi:nucleotide-binding universal stress UspA family protein
VTRVCLLPVKNLQSTTALKLKKILASTDLSKLSLVGVRYALLMARDRGARVFVYHVGVEVQELVELCGPYKKIIQKAAKEGADLIVVSTHGRTGPDQFIVGSVAQRVIARAPCPVLSLRPSKRRRGRSA